MSSKNTVTAVTDNAKGPSPAVDLQLPCQFPVNLPQGRICIPIDPEQFLIRPYPFQHSGSPFRSTGRAHGACPLTLITLISCARAPLFPMTSRIQETAHRHQSQGSCSAQEGRGVTVRYSLKASAAEDRSCRNSSHFTVVVPMSMPIE